MGVKQREPHATARPASRPMWQCHARPRHHLAQPGKPITCPTDFGKLDISDRATGHLALRPHAANLEPAHRPVQRPGACARQGSQPDPSDDVDLLGALQAVLSHPPAAERVDLIGDAWRKVLAGSLSAPRYMELVRALNELRSEPHCRQSRQHNFTERYADVRTAQTRSATTLQAPVDMRIAPPNRHPSEHRLHQGFNTTEPQLTFAGITAGAAG
jgi:hypothetical protein